MLVSRKEDIKLGKCCPGKAGKSKGRGDSATKKEAHWPLEVGPPELSYLFSCLLLKHLTSLVSNLSTELQHIVQHWMTHDLCRCECKGPVALACKASVFSGFCSSEKE